MVKRFMLDQPNLKIMSEGKFLIKQRGLELQEILDRDVILTDVEYEALKESGKLEDNKLYFVIEEEE